MALSNWDTIAFDEESKPTNGVFVSPLGVRVSIYKNWIYVNDKNAWEEGGQFIKDCVMEIQSGHVIYKDVHIDATRGPQNGVYVVVQSWIYAPYMKNPPCSECKQEYRHKDTCSNYVDIPDRHFVMVGCGVSGYDDSGEFVGALPSSVEFLRRWIHGEDESEDEDYSFDEEVRSIQFDKPLRFNQGDAFFANHENKDIPASPPGEAATPVIFEKIDRLKL